MSKGGAHVPTFRTIALTVLIVAAAASPARADGFVIPFYGFNFGGDSGNCSTFQCEDKRANFGVSFGFTGPVFGFEEDLAFAKDFYGEVPTGGNSVFTLMSNLIIGVGRGPVQPYVLIGGGLVRSRVDVTLSQFHSDNNSLGYDVGGGVKAYFTDHVGIRGDIRKIHTLQDVDIPVFGDPVGQVFVGQRLDFYRASVGLALRF
jgi:opacity protein-like surface antigen